MDSKQDHSHNEKFTCPVAVL